MKIVTLRLPDWILKAIDILIEKKYYTNRSEFLRKAVEELLKKHVFNKEITNIEITCHFWRSEINETRSHNV